MPKTTSTNKNSSQEVQLKNPRTGEIWACSDFHQRKIVDGVEFVEVHRPDNARKVWINLTTLVKVKKNNQNS